MLFGADNFLVGLKALITGDPGILRDVPLPTSSMATTGTRATAENAVPADAIILDANGEDAIATFTIPRDYDTASDVLKVVFLVAHVSGTSLTVQPSAVSKGSPTEAYAAVTGFTAPDATTVNAAFGIGEVEADLSGLDWDFKDNLAVNLAAAGVTGSGIGHVLGARVEYRSMVVSHDRTDAAGTALR